MQQLQLIKIGGKILEDKSQLHDSLSDFSKISGPKILVHGGGRKSDELCLKLGIEPKMIQGRRITDEDTLEVVTMVYAGLLNKNVVGILQSLGCNAIGMSGADGNAILCRKREKETIDYGLAGDVERVNSSLLSSLLQNGITPVLCSITHDGKGQLLNTNADTIATELAKAMAPYFEVKLTYCFEKKGVLSDPNDDTSVINKLNWETYKTLKARGVITEGMIPKLDNAFAAQKAGVQSIVIGSPSSIHPESSDKGTEICL
jgi:acetylglutamate kinase